MNQEGVDHTKYEDLLRQININSRYDYLFPNNKIFQLASFGYNGISARMSE